MSRATAYARPITDLVGSGERLARFGDITYKMSDLVYNPTEHRLQGDFFYRLRARIPDYAVPYNIVTHQKRIVSVGDYETYKQAREAYENGTAVNFREDKYRYWYDQVTGIAFDALPHRVHVRVRENHTKSLATYVYYDMPDDAATNVSAFTPVFVNSYWATGQIYDETDKITTQSVSSDGTLGTTTESDPAKTDMIRVSQMLIGRSWDAKDPDNAAESANKFDYVLRPVAGAPFTAVSTNKRHIMTNGDPQTEDEWLSHGKADLTDASSVPTYDAGSGTGVAVISTNGTLKQRIKTDGDHKVGDENTNTRYLAFLPMSFDMSNLNMTAAKTADGNAMEAVGQYGATYPMPAKYTNGKDVIPGAAVGRYIYSIEQVDNADPSTQYHADTEFACVYLLDTLEGRIDVQIYYFHDRACTQQWLNGTQTDNTSGSQTAVADESKFYLRTNAGRPLYRYEDAENGRVPATSAPMVNAAKVDLRGSVRWEGTAQRAIEMTVGRLGVSSANAQVAATGTANSDSVVTVKVSNNTASAASGGTATSYQQLSNVNWNWEPVADASSNFLLTEFSGRPIVTHTLGKVTPHDKYLDTTAGEWRDRYYVYRVNAADPETNAGYTIEGSATDLTRRSDYQGTASWTYNSQESVAAVGSDGALYGTDTTTGIGIPSITAKNSKVLSASTDVVLTVEEELTGRAWLTQEAAEAQNTKYTSIWTTDADKLKADEFTFELELTGKGTYTNGVLDATPGSVTDAEKAELLPRTKNDTDNTWTSNTGDNRVSITASNVSESSTQREGSFKPIHIEHNMLTPMGDGTYRGDYFYNMTEVIPDTAQAWIGQRAENGASQNSRINTNGEIVTDAQVASQMTWATWKTLNDTAKQAVKDKLKEAYNAANKDKNPSQNDTYDIMWVSKGVVHDTSVHTVHVEVEWDGDELIGSRVYYDESTAQDGTQHSAAAPVFKSTYDAAGLAWGYIVLDIGRPWRDGNETDANGKPADKIAFNVAAVGGAIMDPTSASAGEMESTNTIYTTPPMTKDSLQVDPSNPNVRAILTGEGLFQLYQLSSNGTGVFVYAVTEADKCTDNGVTTTLEQLDLRHDTKTLYLKYYVEDRKDGTLNVQANYFRNAACTDPSTSTGLTDFVYIDKVTGAVLDMTNKTGLDKVARTENAYTMHRTAVFNSTPVSALSSDGSITLNVDWVDDGKNRPSVEDHAKNLHLLYNNAEVSNVTLKGETKKAQTSTTSSAGNASTIRYTYTWTGLTGDVKDYSITQSASGYTSTDIREESHVEGKVTVVDETPTGETGDSGTTTVGSKEVNGWTSAVYSVVNFQSALTSEQKAATPTTPSTPAAPSAPAAPSTPTVATTSAKATVKWDDESNKDGSRPNYVELTVVQSTDDKTWTDADKKLRVTGNDDENTWTATIEGLPETSGSSKLSYAFADKAAPKGYEVSGDNTQTLTYKHEPADDGSGGSGESGGTGSGAATKADVTLMAHMVELVAAAVPSSTDGANVKSTEKWANAEAHTKLADAAAEALAVADTDDATTKQLAAAYAALSSAYEEFENALQPGLIGLTFTVENTTGTYTYKAGSNKTATLLKAEVKAKKKATINTAKHDGVNFKVTAVGAKAFAKSPAKAVVLGANVKKIGASAFTGASKVKTLTVKSKKLTKKGVKGSLKGSKVKKVSVKASGSKKARKTLVKRYKGYFAKKNSSKKVTVK